MIFMAKTQLRQREKRLKEKLKKNERQVKKRMSAKKDREEQRHSGGDAMRPNDLEIIINFDSIRPKSLIRKVLVLILTVVQFQFVQVIFCK